MRKFYAVAYNNDYALNYTDEHDRDEWCEGYHLHMPCSAKFAKYMVYGHIETIKRGE